MDDDERVIAETAAAFAEKRLAPYALEWDEKHHFPTDVLGGVGPNLQRVLGHREIGAGDGLR